jgi:hypothetical protein
MAPLPFYINFNRRYPHDSFLLLNDNLPNLIRGIVDHDDISKLEVIRTINMLTYELLKDSITGLSLS